MKSAVDSLATIEPVDTVAEAASTVEAPTRIMPIIRAPAVLAVRRGLRVTLPRASLPRGLNATTNTAARTLRVRLAITGARTRMPMTRAPAPTPTVAGPFGVGLAMAAITPAAPATMSSALAGALLMVCLLYTSDAADE